MNVPTAAGLKVSCCSCPGPTNSSGPLSDQENKSHENGGKHAFRPRPLHRTRAVGRLDGDNGENDRNGDNADGNEDDDNQQGNDGQLPAEKLAIDALVVCFQTFRAKNNSTKKAELSFSHSLTFPSCVFRLLLSK